ENESLPSNMVEATPGAIKEGIKTYFQPTPPIGGEIGDIWYDTSDGNKPYRWDGSQWVSIAGTSTPSNPSPASKIGEGTYFSGDGTAFGYITLRVPALPAGA